MNCPHCKIEIENEAIVHAASVINGSKKKTISDKVRKAASQNARKRWAQVKAAK